MWRGEVLVELPNGSDQRQSFERESPGMRGSLATHARLEAANEVPLIDKVRAAFEGVDARRKFDDGRNRAHAFQRRRRRAAVVAGELQREISAQRVAGDNNAIDALTAKFGDDVRRVGGETGVI